MHLDIPFQFECTTNSQYQFYSWYANISIKTDVLLKLTENLFTNCNIIIFNRHWVSDAYEFLYILKSFDSMQKIQNKFVKNVEIYNNKGNSLFLN